MRYVFLILVLTTMGFQSLQAQDLYIPRDIQSAYKKGTRSMDGKPGKNYWQNHGRYDINITVAPPDRTVKGRETIMYFNNSTDTLRNPVIKLFMNIHKQGAPRDGGVSDFYLNSGVRIDSVTANGQGIRWQNTPLIFTNRAVRLPKPLAPHDSVLLTFEWHYDISLESNREGRLDSTTYFLAYFYPRIAVLDDYNGWDRMEFTDGKEFYSDFNDYKLTVNAPKNFVVWATGDLQNPQDVLQLDVLTKYRESLTSDKIITLASSAANAAKIITKQNEVNSWVFTCENVPDVAFALSDHYVWDASSVLVDKKTNRRASVQAGYLDNAADFHQMVEFGKHSLDWFSNNLPGVPYPYSKTSIIQGFADMEYPMMVNDNTTPNPEFSRFVAEHEIAHTYFPFYMGINETRYGFMDEGWATTLELFIGRADLGVEKAENLFKQFRVNGWINDDSQEGDIAIITPSNILNGAGLGNNEYGKAALGYLAMKDLLGDDLFKKCLQEYMARWNGKHPTPWDFFFTFNDAAGKNLNWFWHNWFFTTGFIDFAVEKVVKSKKGYDINLKNIGGFVAPVDVKIEYADGSTETLHQTPALWQANQKNAVINVVTKKMVKSVTLDGGIFMDADRSNNALKL
jgi:Peptidase family M1 domain